MRKITSILYLTPAIRDVMVSILLDNKELINSIA